MIDRDSTNRDPRGSLSWFHGRALVGPLLLLVLASLLVLAMGAHLLGGTPLEMLGWALVFTWIGAGSAIWPVFFLAVLGFSCTTLPYLEPVFVIGKQMPLLLAASVTVGAGLGAGKSFVRSTDGGIGWVARPVAVFGSLMLISAVITTLRYSPLIAGWLSSEAFQSFSRVGTAGVEGSTTQFLLRAAGLVVGPVLALVVMSLVAASREQDRVPIQRMATWLMGGILAGLGLSLLVCLGQAWIAGFPLPTRDPRWPTGLMTNPGALATLIALLSPVLLGVLWSRQLPSWLRWIAASDLVLSIAALGPLDSKTGQVGVVVGPVILATLLVVQRVRGSTPRKLLAAAALLLVGVAIVVLAVQALAYASVSDWERFVSEGSFGFRPARLERNRQMILMFLEHPVAGSGVGTFSMLLPSFYDKYGVRWGGPTVLEATNHVLHMAATGGAIVLGVTLWLLVAFFLPPVRRVLSASAQGGIGRLRTALVAGASTYVFFSSWQGETWYYVPVATPFWMVVALCAVLSREEWPRRRRSGVTVVCGLVVVYALGHWLYI